MADWGWGLVMIAFGFAQTYLWNYFQEKGKNAATKEDVKSLTTIVEEIKSGIEKRSKRDSFRYEKEYTILSEILDKLVKFKRVAADALQYVDRVQDKKYMEQRDEYFCLYRNASLDLRDSIEKNRPFYEADLYDKLMQMHDLLHQWLTCSASVTSAKPEEFDKMWSKYEGHNTRVNEFADGIFDAVRKRVTEWGEL